MKKFRIGLMIFAFIVIVGHLTVFDYTDMSWSENAGSYLGITSMILVLISMVYSNRYVKKNKTK